MSKKTALLVALLLGVLVIYALRNPYYLDRQFHYLTKTDKPSIEVVLTVTQISIEDTVVIFEPPLTIKERILEDTNTDIKELKKIEEETFGARMVYHYSLIEVSGPIEDPQWGKRMILETLFYRRDSIGQWNRFTGATHIINDLKGTDEPQQNSFLLKHYKTKKHYGMHYEFTIK